MKRKIKIAALALLLSFSCTKFTCAQEIQTSEGEDLKKMSDIPVIETQSHQADLISANTDVVVSAQTPPSLVAPVVEEPKRILKPANRKVDLQAIIFDPSVTVKLPAEAEEMSKTDTYKYKINEALHGYVSTPSTKGLLEDTMKMTFEKGLVESIAPWIDFSGNFSGIWNGENYENTLYGLNFCDVGINGKFRTDDDPASGKKTVFRLMYNVGKEIPGNTYLQSFMADNYIMRHWSKNDQVLVGYARAAVGIEGGESPFTIPFYARSQIARTYGNVRTLGIKAQGNHKYYDYSAGFFSSGRFFKDFFPGTEFTGLVSFKPLAFKEGKWGNLVAGGSLNAGNADSNYTVGGAHLIYEYKRMKASFEYAAADGSNGSTGFSKNQSEGFYGTLAYRITPRIQAIVRYDQFDPNKSKRNDIRREYTAGLNYFVKGQALKFMLNYVLYSVENGNYGNRILFGTQIIL